MLKITKATPILVVDAIEPVLPFWTGPLGFEKQVEVPHEGHVGFVILARAGKEVMMQTRASLEVDVPAVAKTGVTSILYMDVPSIDAAIAATKGLEVLVPKRDTPYGAREIFVRDAAGNVLGFAEHVSR
jgi:uncharacterized glyoxalase superfamily protein PhnB